MKPLPVEGFFEVPPLAEQQAIRDELPSTICAWCKGTGEERSETVEARACRHCGGDGAA